MDTGKFVGLLLAFLVGALVLVAFVPIIEETTSETKTFENKGLYYMTNPTETVHVEYTGGTNWVIDDVPLDYTVLGATNIIVFDDNFIRNVGQVRGSISVSMTSADLTISNGVISGTVDNNGTSTEVNWTYTTIYVAVPESAEYIMTNPNNTTYIKADSVMYGCGLTSVIDSDNNNQLIPCYVNVNGLDATVTSANNIVTISDVVVNATPVNGFNDLYIFTSVTFKVTWGDNVTDCTYNIIIAPSEVTAEKEYHPDSTLATVIDLLPFIAGVGLLMGAVAYFLRRY